MTGCKILEEKAAVQARAGGEGRMKKDGNGKGTKRNVGALGSKVDEDADERDGRAKSSREIGIAARIHIFRRNYKCNASFFAA